MEIHDRNEHCISYWMTKKIRIFLFHITNKWPWKKQKSIR